MIQKLYGDNKLMYDRREKKEGSWKIEEER
jgi:hypothetical protein